MTHEETEIFRKLLNSETLNTLIEWANALPINTQNPADFKTALAIAGAYLINAMDNKRIHFDNEVDSALFLGLLTFTTDYVMDGELKNAAITGTIH